MAISRAEERIGIVPTIGVAVEPPVGVQRSLAESDLITEAEPTADIVRGTPYARVLRLTRDLVKGARTDYAAVSRIQRFLNANYVYDQEVEPRHDPLPAFLLRDRRGYCQQFAGAMALMLRMTGIPSRVVSGFAPGVPDGEGFYSVSDTDAHSWVEVLYPGIGWVIVDPTPAQTPAHTNVTIPVAGGRNGATESRLGRALTEGEDPRESSGSTGNGGAEDGDGFPLAVLAAFVIGGSAASVVYRRRRRLRTAEGGRLQLRELQEAMSATGFPAGPGTTLATIQSRLSVTAGPDAARYAGGLLESRYGRRSRRRPGPAERRAFRWALARSAGPLNWWRALRAVPPGGPRA